MVLPPVKGRARLWDLPWPLEGFFDPATPLLLGAEPKVSSFLSISLGLAST